VLTQVGAEFAIKISGPWSTTVTEPQGFSATVAAMTNHFAADDFDAIRLRLAELKLERAAATAGVRLPDRPYCDICGAVDHADVPNKCHGACLAPQHD